VTGGSISGTCCLVRDFVTFSSMCPAILPVCADGGAAEGSVVDSFEGGRFLWRRKVIEIFAAKCEYDAIDEERKNEE